MTPALTNEIPATAIIGILFVVRITAAVYHAAPNSVQVSMGFCDCVVFRSTVLSIAASAALVLIGRASDYLLAAIALHKPHVLSRGQNNKPAIALTNTIRQVSFCGPVALKTTTTMGIASDKCAGLYGYLVAAIASTMPFAVADITKHNQPTKPAYRCDQ